MKVKAASESLDQSASPFTRPCEHFSSARPSPPGEKVRDKIIVPLASIGEEGAGEQIFICKDLIIWLET
jgi:hypothetical protein